MAQGKSESKKQKDMARRAETYSPENVAKRIMAEEAKKVRKRPDSTAQLEPGDSSRFLAHAIEVATFPVTDMEDPQAVGETVFTYFSLCQQHDMKPHMAGLALALKLTRSDLYEYINGNKGRGEKAKDVANVLKMARQLLDTQLNDYMQNRKIDTVAGIFLMKNGYGYSDKQEIEIKTPDPLGEKTDPEELRQKYIEGTAIIAEEE